MTMKKTMKLVSWNVDGRSNKKTLSEQLQKIKNESGDILALQEVNPKTIERFKKELAESDLKHTETRSARQAYASKARNSSLLIASRWEVKQIDMVDVPWEESVLSVIINSPFGEIEIHTTHIPPGSSNGWIKIDTFDGIFDALAKKSDRHRVLCGDFNSPEAEHSNGDRIMFGDDVGYTFRRELTTPSDERAWGQRERRVICGLAKYDLTDIYRELHRYEKTQYSHFNKNKKTKGRFDHIFSSRSLKPIDCDYLHPFSESDSAPHLPANAVYQPGRFLSDHLPVYAVYEPKLIGFP